MRDLPSAEKNRLIAEWKTRLDSDWLRPGESVAWLMLPMRGYAGSIVAGGVTAPHIPSPGTRQWVDGPPNWPLPSDPVTSGTCMNDEWADDPSVVWWALAEAADRTAVRFADHVAAAHGNIVVVLTSGRLALVAEQGKIDDDPQPDGEPTGWLGRARAAAAQVQKTAEGLGSRKDAKLPISYFEVPVGDIAAVDSRRTGRSIPHSHFLEVNFTDRSTLLIRKMTAGNYVDKSGSLRRS
ncbi:hypothetical protein [Saccharopolyspora sp. 6M]|uniref:hypothetical protein n=1 Tax=Saccharopolyspora sp. 6M TaxID=2877237 RepID=UPI001CD71825|nr:hypothetical protein [Saccharopolyspora sp. 6M]MCA1229768.1 hypothetical protein [Saccharopolyspora sp. 6M]